MIDAQRAKELADAHNQSNILLSVEIEGLLAKLDDIIYEAARNGRYEISYSITLPHCCKTAHRDLVIEAIENKLSKESNFIVRIITRAPVNCFDLIIMW